MSKKIISKASLKSVLLTIGIAVCGVFCFDYIISNEALAFDVEVQCDTGGGNGPEIDNGRKD